VFFLIYNRRQVAPIEDEALRSDEGKPLYRAVADSLSRMIKKGVYPKGSRLPSIRRLARDHNVSTMTALQAPRYLENQRLIEAHPRSGFFVADSDVYKKKESKLSELGFQEPVDERVHINLSMIGASGSIGLDLAGGDMSLYPVRRLGILMRQLIYREPGLLGEQVRGTGYLPLKKQVILRAAEYGCQLTMDEISVTSGCVESLDLALRATTRPGDTVLVQSPTYYLVLHMLRSLDLNIIEIPADEAGIDLRSLNGLIESRGIKVAVFISNFNNPTGFVLPETNKKAIIDVASRHDLIIIEDDVYGDVHFGAARPRPLRAYSERVILCSSFSKTVSPGIRIGWVAGSGWADRIAAIKYITSKVTPVYPQAALAEFLRSGGYDIHLRRLRKTMSRYVREVREGVIKYFPPGTHVANPSGGFVLWVKLPIGCADTREIFRTASGEGINIAPGYLFSQNNEYSNCLRINAGMGWSPKIERSIRTLAAIIFSTIKI
jgi:DNA-binding transcriptional MocR family regulator